MSQDVTASTGVEQGPEWRTLKGLEAPLRMWGSWTGDHFSTAGDRKQPTGEPVVLVRVWSERGTARYGETADGRTVYLGGAATKFWVQAGAGEEAPAAEEPEVVEASVTVDQARGLADRVHGRTEEFEELRGEGGRLLGWTFRSGRLHGARYGWVTGAGTVAKGLEAYRSYAGDVLVHADRDDRERAGQPVETGCVHDRYPRTDVQGDPVLGCATMTEGDTFAVFDMGNVSGYMTCAVEAANVAARMGGWDEYEGADPQPYWAKVCGAHPEAVAGRCSACGQDTPDEDAPEAAADEEAPAPLFVAGDLVVCADGIRRTVERMAPRVEGEPERVIVEGGAEWIAGNCRRANRDDLHEARTRSSRAAERVRTNPDTEDPEWREALATLAEALDFLKLADPLYAHLREHDAKEAARSVHADAHDFQPFHNPADPVPVAGWTFRTGHGSGARYGVVTAAVQVSGVGLYEYRTTAERAHLYGQEPEAGRS